MSEEEYMSFVDGHPTISQSDESEAGIVRNISTLNDRPTIPQSPEKSTSQETSQEDGLLYGHAYVEINGIAHECEHGVMREF